MYRIESIIQKNIEKYKDLYKFLNISSGDKFSFIFLICDIPAVVKEIVKRLNQELGSSDIELAEIDFSASYIENLRIELKEKLSQTRHTDKRYLILTGLETSIDLLKPSPLLRSLNVQRDLYTDEFPFSIVFVLPHYAAEQFRNQARDFYDWRSSVIILETTKKDTLEGANIQPQVINIQGKPSVPLKSMDNIATIIEQKINEYKDDIPKQRIDAREKGALHLELANIYINNGKYTNSSKHLNLALRIFEMIDDKNGKINVLLNFGNIKLNKDDYEGAIKHFKQALKLSQAIGDRNNETACYGSLGNAYQSLSQYEMAKEHYEIGLSIALEIGDKRNECSCLGSLGNIYIFLGQYDSAIKYLEKKFKIVKEIGDRFSENEIIYHANIGSVYLYLGQYERAKEHYENGISIAQKIGYRKAEGACIGGLGNVHYSFSQYWEAIEHYKKALTKAKEIGDRQAEGGWQGDLGNAYYNLGQYQEAKEYYKKALTIAKEIRDKQAEGIWQGNLGNAYASLDNYKKSIECFKEGLSIAQKIGDKESERSKYYNLGTLYTRNLKDDTNGEIYFLKSIKVIKEIIGELKEEEYKESFYSKAVDAFYSLAALYVRKGDGVKAFNICEDAKAQSLVELIGSRDITPKLAPNDLREKFHSLKIEKKGLRYRLRQQNYPSDIKHKIEEMDKEYDEILNKIKCYDPLFIDTVSPQSISISEITDIIPRDKNTVLLEFFLNFDNILIFLIDRNGLYENKCISIGIKGPHLIQEIYRPWYEKYYELKEARKPSVEADKAWKDIIEDTINKLSSMLWGKEGR